MSSDWCTIESDPGVFTSLIESFGVEGVEMEELWSLDDAALATIVNTPVHGLVFLFKWVQQMEATDTRPVCTPEETPETLFFAKQVITNACATQALLSMVLNADVKTGDMLSNFKSFTLAFDPEMRGEAIGNAQEIRDAHNSFGRRDDPFIREQDKHLSSPDDEAFHFVAFIPFEGKVYELDGLKKGPILVGDAEDGSMSGISASWLGVARKAVQDRIQRYGAAEIKFNLMAMVQDKRIPIREALEKAAESGSDNSSEADDLRAQLMALEEKREQWKIENDRRKHNYIPFVLELLKAMAKSGKLPEITKKASENYAEKKRKMSQGGGSKGI
eukprot:CAMPEP_0116018488 /NCGR_PEP_ID=MMETSP0321-20121206/8678_1 /TAXON_ID=163516 /ORGANISM="Leptocylindrus danicus var. danicus, Strain B650" /LENGTH=330 /DNA_ID=CAMNT_0003488891 /DNA_START=318 /DNA_END=1310 /DNA_ORIENTATION=+